MHTIHATQDQAYPLAVYGSIAASNLSATNGFAPLIDCSFNGTESSGLEADVLASLGLSKQPSGFVLAPGAAPRTYNVHLLGNFEPRGEVNVKAIGLHNASDGFGAYFGAVETSLPTNGQDPTCASSFKVFLANSNSGFWIVGGAQNNQQRLLSYKIWIS